jgi:hypothetical protein
MYKVQFVGLVCFYRDHGDRLALLPDGRDPGPGIDKHYGEISVGRDAIESLSGWDDETQASAGGTFLLPACEIVLEGADIDGVLESEAHDAQLPSLRRIDPNFDIDPARARTVARVRIRRGKLTAYRVPQGDALMSQLDVPHDGSITITVKPDDDSKVRTIRVKPGTEIAITNMARGVYGRADETPAERESHFKIYEKLSSRPVVLHEPVLPSTVDETTSAHPMFAVRRGPIGLYPGCSNTGCC